MNDAEFIDAIFECINVQIDPVIEHFIQVDPIDILFFFHNLLNSSRTITFLQIDQAYHELRIKSLLGDYNLFDINYLPVSDQGIIVYSR